MAAAMSISPEPKEFPDWVLLRSLGRTHTYSDAGAAFAAVKGDLTAVEAGTSDGGVAYLSFALCPVPSISYLELHWPYDDAPGAWPAVSSIVSVDQNHILIRMEHHLRGTDLFVYTAHAPSSPPSLRRLPTVDDEIQGLASRFRFLEIEECIGILRRDSDDNDDYIVADLAVSCTVADRDRFSGMPSTGFIEDDLPLLMVRLCTFTSKTGEWVIKELPALQPGDQDQFPLLWSCDEVVPFAGRDLCWVDYYSGFLIRDFSDEDSSCLSYVQLPGKQYSQSDKIRIDRKLPESFRRLAVSQGEMRFIHIGDDYDQDDTTGPLKVTVWSLKMTEGHVNWDVHRVINLSDLWVQPTYKDRGLPHRLPEYPLFIKNDPDALCCVLRDEERRGKAWIIMLDMNHLALKSITPYIIHDLVENVACDFVPFKNEPPLVPSVFSKYLQVKQRDIGKFAIHPSKRSKVELRD